MDSIGKIPLQYIEKVKNRSKGRFLKGFAIRLFLYFKYLLPRIVARLMGATVGSNSIIPMRLALHCNKNFKVGEDVIIETPCIDMRGPVIIEPHVIINRGVEIIRLSHIIDDNTIFTTKKYPPLVIESYSWIATGAKIMPSCWHIEKGTVIGAYSVVVSNTKEDSVYSGFPAKELRKHNSKFDDLVVVSLMGGDLYYYLKARHL